jgi:hypothetical protein
MILKVDIGESVEDFAGSGAHVTVWTAKFGEYMRDEE